MDEIETRLRDTAENCQKAYGVWSKSKRDVAAREAMAEAIHELRKVGVRLEIELGASERAEMTQRPIPVPPHRSAQRRTHDDGLPQFITGGYDEDDDDGAQPMPQRGQHGGRHQNNNRDQSRNNNQQRNQSRDQSRDQQPQQAQQQAPAAASAPAAPAKTVTLERRFGRGRPAAAAAPASDAPKPEPSDTPAE